MASLSFIHFLSLLLLSSFSLFGSLLAHKGQRVRFHTVPISYLLPSSDCIRPNGSDPSKLNLFHRHGPCSPLNSGSKPSHLQILEHDRARVRSLHHKASKASNLQQSEATTGSITTRIPNSNGGSLDTGNYLVTIGFGSPQKLLSVVLDTGSDLTWIQCSPCSNCYKQLELLFDPTQSSTNRAITCGSTDCNILDEEDDSNRCSSTKSSCRYSVKYNDKSTTDGSLVRDTLTLNPSNVIPNFVFGCGDHNSGLFGEAAGLIGLGRQKVSFVSQTTQMYGGVFSYCLPSSSSSSGYLKLGGGPPANVKFTPMLSKTGMEESFYFVNLVSISVGGQKLPIAPTAFSDPGTLIDSGTVITRIPPAAYSTLSSAFRRMMPKIYPMVKPLDILDTCYDFTGYHTVKIPAVTFEFDKGAIIDVDFDGLLYVGSLSQACLAFAPNEKDDEVVIIGNVHQRRYNVVYDVANKRIGFGPKGCH